MSLARLNFGVCLFGLEISDNVLALLNLGSVFAFLFALFTTVKSRLCRDEQASWSDGYYEFSQDRFGIEPPPMCSCKSPHKPGVHEMLSAEIEMSLVDLLLLLTVLLRLIPRPALTQWALTLPLPSLITQCL